MKIYISADLEGISGVVGKEHVDPKGSEYSRARELMTQEVNAAIRGAFKGGASEVVVNDAHGPMTNIMIEKLEPQAELITGTPKNKGMMAGLTEEFEQVFLIGYHAKKGKPGILSHSYSGATVGKIELNGLEVGESGLNSFLAGSYQVPVSLISGDDRAVEELRELIGEQLKTAPVKSSLTRFAARCLSPEKACGLIEEQANLAVQDSRGLKPLEPESPLTLEVTFLDRGLAERAAQIPGAELDDAVVTYKHDNMLHIYQAVQTMLMLVR